jgi:hypothetical protein
MHSSAATTKQLMLSTAILPLRDSDPKSSQIPKFQKTIRSHKEPQNTRPSTTFQKYSKVVNQLLIKLHLSHESIPPQVIAPEPNTLGDLKPTSRLPNMDH